MSTLTSEQRAVKRASRAAAEAKLKTEEAMKHQEDEIKFRNDLPKRLLNLMAMAASLDISADVKLTEVGPTIWFNKDGAAHDDFIGVATLTYQSEEWEVAVVEAAFKQIVEKKIEDQRLKQVAQSVFNELTDYERCAIKKFINYLK